MRLPRRLWEAYVGALAARVAPDAELWAPRRQLGHGFGSDPREALSLVLQCSLVEERVQGPSTRVSRTTLAGYMADDLVEWREYIWFVLVGTAAEPGTNSPENPFELAWTQGAPSFAPVLYAVRMLDLWAFVLDQGRGTVSAQGLDWLRGMPAGAVDRPAAEPLEDVIAAFAGPDAFDPGVPRAPGFQSVDPILAEHWWRNPFQRPMPIALRFPRAH
jgi:hypothetical protein